MQNNHTDQCLNCDGPLQTDAGAPAAGICGRCIAKLPKSRGLALLDGVAHLLWIHGGVTALLAFGVIISSCGGLKEGALAIAAIAYGVVLAIVAVLQIFAGLRIQEYRSWGAGIAACVGALVAAPACGGVASLLLFGVGLGVLLQPGVRAGFRKIDEGMSQREMERLHLPPDDEKFALWLVFAVIGVSVLLWVLLGALALVIGQLM